MVYRNPYLRLDELKTARDDEQFERNVQTSRQFAEMPLALDKLMKENESRAQKIEQQKFENKSATDKQAEVGRANLAGEAETNRTNLAKEGIGTGKVEVSKASEARRGKTAEQKSSDKVLEDVAFGRISTTPDLDDDAIVDSILAQPGQEGYNPDQVSAAVARARMRVQGEKFKQDTTNEKLGMEKQRITDARARANRPRAPAAPRPRFVGEAFTNKVGEMRSLQAKAKAILDEVETIDDSKIGLLEDLKEKYGSIVGIQDNQTRMQYASLFNNILKLRSGTAVTPNELTRLEQEIPSWRAGRGVIADSLVRMIEDTDRDVELMEEVQGSYGRTLTPSPPKGSRSQPAAKPPTPRNPGERTKAWVGRLVSAGYSEQEIMKMISGGQ